MLTVQRVCQTIVLGMLAFVMFGISMIAAAVGSTNPTIVFGLIGMSLCCLIAYLKDRWIKEEKGERSSPAKDYT